MSDIKSVGVLGGGLMGSGIAQVAAVTGHETLVREVSPELIARVRGGIEQSLAKLVEKGKLGAADRDAAFERLRYTTVTADLRGCDIIVEAVPEDLAIKNALWKELDALCGPATIFASNTSSLTIAAMAAVTTRADRFVGLDTTHRIAEIMFAEYREPRYAPPALLKRMVLAGMYGKKNGRGFYDYSSNPPVVSTLGL